MRKWLSVFFAGIILFFSGCATYKQLKPDPEISPKEKGFIRLDNDGKSFELDKGKKYYIKFPRSESMNYYIIVSTSMKQDLNSFMTDEFDDDKKMPRLEDKSKTSDSLGVYPVDTTKTSYYWVIDTVKGDLKISFQYRYSPRWRFDFENKHHEFKEALKANRTQRETYNGINSTYDFSKLQFENEITTLEKKYLALLSLDEQLKLLEKIFPQDIANTKDSAYQNYLELKSATTDEIDFQKKYSLALEVFKVLYETKTDFEVFLNSAEYFLDFFDKSEKLSKNVLDRLKSDIFDVLQNSGAYYSNIINQKQDAAKFTLNPDIEIASQLYSKVTSKTPPAFEEIYNFFAKYNEEVMGLENADLKYEQIQIKFQNNPVWPGDNFYSALITLADEMKGLIPESNSSNNKTFGKAKCSQLMSKRISETSKRANELYKGLVVANKIVPQINIAKQKGDYLSIIKLLIPVKNLSYLIEQYPGVDNSYIESVKIGISNLLQKNSFALAENSMRAFLAEKTFLNPGESEVIKNQLILQFETSLFEQVRAASKAAVDAFAAKNEFTIDNIPALYRDSVFNSPYLITFASAGENVVKQRRAAIQDYLNNIKFVSFPENAIKKIYSEFQRNIFTRGVDKARAIAIHGRNYKGNDQNTRYITAECDVYSAKWIMSPKAFRRVFALPITDNRGGVNEYMFQLVLRIPSEGEFPSFDINIKLQPEIAKNAGTQQWYDWIAVNGKAIQNEGRLRVTSPNVTNDYTFQVTPISMDKYGNNILEVRFKYPDFRVFEVSVMAQEAIIR